MTQCNYYKVVVIVVTYNGTKWIDKCLDSLRKSSVPVHVLVIDNASQDDTAEVVKTKFTEVEFIRLSENIGFGAANNIGFKRALEIEADYVLLLNQDAWIENDTIEKLIYVAEENKKYAILSPFHYSYDGKATERYFNDWVLRNYTPDLFDTNDEKLKEVYPSKFVHAACWLMPIETVKLVGGFDPLFFHYGEDNDYVQRAYAKNKLIGIVPQSKVYHQGTNEGLEKNEQNIPFQSNQVLLSIKNPVASNLGSLLLFSRQYLKTYLDSNNVIRKKAFSNNLKKFIKIYQSRKIQKRSFAYLK